MGDVKDLDPDVVQGVLNFIDTNTQVPETLEVPEDVKEGMGWGPQIREQKMYQTSLVP